MNLVWSLPLLFAFLLVLPLGLERVHRPTSLLVSRVALSLFGRYVARESPRKQDQLDRLRAAHVEQTHRVYAARTLLFSLLLGVAGSVFGVYGAALLLYVLRIGGEAIRAALPSALSFLADLTRVTQLAIGELFVLLLFSSATVGALLALGTYYARWELLDQRAHARATEIEATLPRTIAFVYALSRSGMSFPKVLETLTENREVYGEAAVEIGVAVRDMNTFGTDVLTALERLGARTPSESMEEFSENLASVLGSGQSLSEFLRDQYERYQEEAEAQQEQYLELLSTFAEAYVTVLVAGPLFFITILVVIGLVLQNTLTLLRLVAYLAIPLASVGFMVYIDSVTQSYSNPTTEEVTARAEQWGVLASATAREAGADGDGLTDGGVAVDDDWADSRERLAEYDRLERVLDWLGDPLGTLFGSPAATLLVTVPVGLWWLWARVGAVPLSPLAAARAFDHPLVEATVFVVAVYALVHEVNKRRVRAIESAVPDFLDRLASINEAGMSVVESIDRLTRSDLDALTDEIQRTWRDIQWGAEVQTAFRNMDRRVGSGMVSRAVTLVANAMAVSGDIAPVLTIAADEARASQRLRRERRQEMLTYLMVIYISFLVFIGIIVALSVSFVPAIQQAELSSGGGAAGQLTGGLSTGLFSGVGSVDTGQYLLLFFHTASIQAVCSGLIAGQLGEGSLADGAKHVVVLLVVTLVAFAFI